MHDVPPGIPRQMSSVHLCAWTYCKIITLQHPVRPVLPMSRNSKHQKIPYFGRLVGIHKKIKVNISLNAIWINFRVNNIELGCGTGRNDITPWFKFRGWCGGIPRYCPGQFLAREASPARKCLGWDVTTGTSRYNRYCLNSACCDFCPTFKQRSLGLLLVLACERVKLETFSFKNVQWSVDPAFSVFFCQVFKIWI